MMYQAWRRPGTKPRPIYDVRTVYEALMRVLYVQHKAILIKLSALQMPLLTQTAMGGKRMARRPRKMSLPHISFASLSRSVVRLFLVCKSVQEVLRQVDV